MYDRHCPALSPIRRWADSPADSTQPLLCRAERPMHYRRISSMFFIATSYIRISEWAVSHGPFMQSGSACICACSACDGSDCYKRGGRYRRTSYNAVRVAFLSWNQLALQCASQTNPMMGSANAACDEHKRFGQGPFRAARISGSAIPAIVPTHAGPPSQLEDRAIP